MNSETTETCLNSELLLKATEWLLLYFFFDQTNFLTFQSTISFYLQNRQVF